jgi:hypothetical protein
MTKKRIRLQDLLNRADELPWRATAPSDDGQDPEEDALRAYFAELQKGDGLSKETQARIEAALSDKSKAARIEVLAALDSMLDGRASKQSRKAAEDFRDNFREQLGLPADDRPRGKAEQLADERRAASKAVVPNAGTGEEIAARQVADQAQREQDRLATLATDPRLKALRERVQAESATGIPDDVATRAKKLSIALGSPVAISENGLTTRAEKGKVTEDRVASAPGPGEVSTDGGKTFEPIAEALDPAKKAAGSAARAKLAGMLNEAAGPLAPVDTTPQAKAALDAAVATGRSEESETASAARAKLAGMLSDPIPANAVPQTAKALAEAVVAAPGPQTGDLYQREGAVGVAKAATATAGEELQTEGGRIADAAREAATAIGKTVSAVTSDASRIGGEITDAVVPPVRNAYETLHAGIRSFLFGASATPRPAPVAPGTSNEFMRGLVSASDDATARRIASLSGNSAGTQTFARR